MTRKFDPIDLWTSLTSRLRGIGYDESVAGLLDRQSEAAIQADMESLASRFNVGGLTALVLTIDERLSQDVEDEAIYLLADPSGRPIAGNLLRHR